MTVAPFKHSNYQIGFAFAIGSAALFAVRPIFVKLIYAEGVGSATLIFYRMLFSMPIYIALLCYFLRDEETRLRLSPKLIAMTTFAGILGYFGASYFDLLGLQYVTAQLGRMILYSYPTFVVLLGALFFSKPITTRTVVSLIITYVGIAVIFGHDLNHFGNNVFNGGFFITLSAITFAVYLLMSKSLIDSIGSKVFTCLALISASLGIFSYYFIYAMHQPNVTLNINNRALLLILAVAIFCTVIPTFFTTAAVARIGADKTGIVAMIGPAFTSIFAVFVLHESYTIYHFVGMLLAILGVTLLGRKNVNQNRV